MNFSVNKIVLASILIMSHSILGADVHIQKSWRRPNAWQKDIAEIENDIRCECLPKSENQLLHENSIQVFYKKLLKALFDRNLYRKNNKILQRGILFKINEIDFDLLENSLDPKDWDEIVTKVFKNIESTDTEDFNSVQNILNSALDNLNFYLNNSWSSYFKLNLFTIVIFVLIPVIFLHKRYNYNLIAIGLLAIFLVGYVKEYTVCNNELGIEKVVDLLDDQFHNPCKGFDIQGFDIRVKERRWYNIWSKQSKKEECYEYLRKESKKMDDKDWCTPDNVLYRYIYNNMFLKVFDKIIRKSTDSIQKIYEDLPFPWNYFAGGLFIFLIRSYLEFFFQYVLVTVITRLPGLRDYSQPNNNPPVSQTNQNHEQFQELVFLQNDSINKLANALTIQSVSNRGSSVQILENDENSEPVAALTGSIKGSNETIENKTDINENEKQQIHENSSTDDISKESLNI